MPRPAQPKIYHIVHIDNLASIVVDGFLWPDAIMAQRQGTAIIGMSTIKQRRLHLPISCHPGTNVGDYVPFYFCARSIMLYVIFRGNHPELAYRGGQEPIVHLEADLYRTVQWANETGRRWAFSLSNASAIYTPFRADLNHLNEINWTAVAAADFRQQDIKEAKQAEFLIQDSFPWHRVERIGVHSQRMVQKVYDALEGQAHRPSLEIKRDWYY